MNDALELLLGAYKSIRPSSEGILPNVTEDDPQGLLSLVLAICLAGEYSQWCGVVQGVLHAVNGLADFLGLASIADTRSIDRGVLSQAIWVTLPAVPDRRTRECANIIRRVVRMAGTVDYDLRRVRDMDTERIRKLVETITFDPISPLFVFEVLGRPDLRPLPTGGAASCMCRLGIEGVDWTDGIVGGYEVIRGRARDVLEGMQPEAFLALEWWGYRLGCPSSVLMEDNEGSCNLCPANSACAALCSGLV